MVIDYSDQNKLTILSGMVAERINEILDELGVKLKESSRFLYGPCPVHGGDRFNAFNIYTNGVWACRTHNCQNHFKKSAIGMVRGILSHNHYNWTTPGDIEYSFGRTIRFIESVLSVKYDTLKVDIDAIEKARFANQILNAEKKKAKTIAITREQIRASLQIPAKFYLEKENPYSAEILDKYDIGYCTNKEKEMRYRVVTPVYDENGDFIGCSGRTIFDRCEKCRLYHHENSPCPAKDWQHFYSKWKHSGFKAHENLYNYHNAKKYIQKSSTAIIVESPGNVWRLEESGIHNSVAIFGATISESQKSILDGSGALNIIIIGDNDQAGQSMCEDITIKCERTYRIFCVSIPNNFNDIGDMRVDDVKKYIVPIIEEICNV